MPQREKISPDRYNSSPELRRLEQMALPWTTRMNLKSLSLSLRQFLISPGHLNFWRWEEGYWQLNPSIENREALEWRQRLNVYLTQGCVYSPVIQQSGLTYRLRKTVCPVDQPWCLGTPPGMLRLKWPLWIITQTALFSRWILHSLVPCDCRWLEALTYCPKCLIVFDCISTVRR